jgi:hypothetical protein
MRVDWNVWERGEQRVRSGDGSWAYDECFAENGCGVSGLWVVR